MLQNGGWKGGLLLSISCAIYSCPAEGLCYVGMIWPHLIWMCSNGDTYPHRTFFVFVSRLLFVVALWIWELRHIFARLWNFTAIWVFLDILYTCNEIADSLCCRSLRDFHTENLPWLALGEYMTSSVISETVCMWCMMSYCRRTCWFLCNTEVVNV